MAALREEGEVGCTPNQTASKRGGHLESGQLTSRKSLDQNPQTKLREFLLQLFEAILFFKMFLCFVCTGSCLGGRVRRQAPVGPLFLSCIHCEWRLQANARDSVSEWKRYRVC